MPTHLEAYEIGLITWVGLLLVTGVQGLISVYVEGQELRPLEHKPAREPWEAVLLVAAFTLLELLWAGGFIRGLFSVRAMSELAVYGALLSFTLAASLLVYRRAFVADESLVQERDDGIPW